MKTYTTVQGDMWDSIAYNEMGDTAYTDQLMWANREYLGYLLFPAGVVLTIPEPEETAVDDLPPWKGAVG